MRGVHLMVAVTTEQVWRLIVSSNQNNICHEFVMNET